MLSMEHWLIVLLVVVLVFGTKKLGNIGHDFGRAIRGFKEGIKEGEETSAPTPTQKTTPQSTINQAPNQINHEKIDVIDKH